MKKPTSLTLKALKSLIATFSLATMLHSSAQTVKTLGVFDYANGAWPNAALVQGTDGNLYGMTQINVFRMTPAGQINSISTFCQTPECRIIQTTMAPLVQGSNGNLYGSTDYGEAPTGGTLFKITPAGTYSALLSFPYGSTPNGLIQGVDGNLYGTTKYSSSLSGSVFKITPSGVVTTMYTFCSQTNCADGLLPIGGVVQASDGNFYGTTSEGGAFSVGTVFKITPTGTFTTLYTFCSQAFCVDGAHPMAGLVQGNDGDLYGTTYEGGTDGNGTIFKITMAGTLSTLHTFCTQVCNDGLYPTAALVQGSDGNFYGTTNGDVYCSLDFACGTLFQITPAGLFTLLHTFCQMMLCADGGHPDAPLLQATNGDFYGSNQVGGSSAFSQCQIQSCGTMFRLSMGLAPFVAASPAFGRFGTPVRILGSNLAGTTSVTFNGTPATFTASKTHLSATVPSGATSGWIQVTTPAGVLSSNAVFTVVP